jgi:hypothetical protein
VCTAIVGTSSTCDADEFNGTTLNAHWTPTAVGSAPTYSVAGSTLTITDAAFANTPSAPGSSWIYDLDTDQGNQMAWSKAIGHDDFSVTFNHGWQTSTDGLMIAAVALTDGSGQIQVMAGAMDNDIGGSYDLGTPFTQIRRAGTDLIWRGANAASGSGQMRIVRKAGVVTVYNGATAVATAALDVDVQKVAIVTLKHGSPSHPYDFGTFTLDALSVCWPYEEAAPGMCTPGP